MFELHHRKSFEDYKLKHIYSHQNQSGIALPIALIFLLVCTIIGVSSLRSNVLSERMAGNSIQRNLAFNRAEQALLEGENFVLDNADAVKNAIIGNVQADTCRASFASQNGLCSTAKFPINPSANRTVERWQINNIWDDSSNSFRTATNGARFIVEFMGHILSPNNATNCASPVTTWPYCDRDALLFRITALAVGDDVNARVMLQSTYVAP